MKNLIQKAKLKNDKLEVEYKETFEEDNYSNEVAKSCSQIVHADLKHQMSLLKPHLVALCEQAECKEVGRLYLDSFNPEEQLKNYIVTGYSHGGMDESAGVTIVGQKLLKSGKVLNLVSPFVAFAGIEGDEYEFSGELEVVINGLDYEVEEYLFNDKFGLKQASLDFDAPAEKPKKEKKSKKKKADESFDGNDITASDDQDITDIEFEPIPENEVVHEFNAPEILAEAN